MLEGEVQNSYLSISGILVQNIQIICVNFENYYTEVELEAVYDDNCVMEEELKK